MASKVSFIIQLKNQFSGVAEKVAHQFGKIKAGAQKASRAISKFARKARADLKGVGKSSIKLGASIVAAMAGPALALTAAVKQSVKMEDAMEDIRRVTNASDEQLASFEKTLETMSEKLGKSKEGLAKMAFEGGKLGTSLKDMEPFLEMVSKTAIAFDLADEEAGRAIGSIRAKMGLLNDDTAVLLDSINFLADNTSASGSRMVNIIERVSGSFQLLKVPPQAAAALAGFGDQIEVTSELAASGLNMFFSRMQRMPGMTTKLMNNPLEAVRGTLQKIAAMGPEMQSKFIRKTFGDEAGRFVKKMVANVKLFDKSVEAAFSVDAAGSMERELQNKLGRSSKSFEKFKVTATNTMQAIGDAIKPLGAAVAGFLTPIIDGFGEFAKNNPKLLQLVTIVVAVTAAVGVLAIAVGGLAIAMAVIGAPILIIIGIIAALTTAIAAVAVFWDEIVAGMITSINALLTPLSFLSEKLGFGDIQIAQNPPPVAPSSAVSGSVNGQITVSAAPGAVVEKTSMASKGAGLSIGMNMAGAAQ